MHLSFWFKLIDWYFIMSPREYDIVIYGATGFTGYLTAEYLANNAAKKGMRFAIAGRSEKKLQEVKERLGLEDLSLIVADSSDEDSLQNMTRQCTVLVSTVGPYMKYGKEVVAACVETSTNYCDITGEFPFIYESILEHHEAAKSKDIKIVHSCGYDCIPVDMGAFLASTSLSTPPSRIRALCTAACGLPSGGTLDSGAGMAEWSKKIENKVLKRDPYMLAPDISDHQRVDKFVSSKRSVGYDSTFGTVTIPYFMAGIDNRLVRRSIALRGHSASYDEAMSAGSIARIAGFLALHAPSVVGNLRPKAGDGPPEAIRKNGYFTLETKAENENGEKCTVYVRGQGDPGYQATSAMLAETAMCLADKNLDEGASEEDLDHLKGGVLTPSTALGKELVNRLEDSGIFSFEVKAQVKYST